MVKDINEAAHSRSQRVTVSLVLTRDEAKGQRLGQCVPV